MENIADRIACGIIAAVVGIVMAFLLTWWVDVSVVALLAIVPVACAIAGFVAGDKAVEVFKDIAKWI